MKKINQIALVMIIAALTSCSAYKQVSYLQNSESYNYEKTNQTMYDARIMPKDLLTITVSTSDPASAIPFNLTVPSPSNGSTQSLVSQPTLQQYLVDNEGQIDFPIVGALSLEGLTKSEAEDMIKARLKKYLKETPIVNVRMVNYNISVLGEVARPGVFTIDDEKVNIFEALAMAGDLTIYGQRTDVKLIREDATGKRIVLDTAPIGMVTDTQIISRVANVSVYVCRADYTHKSDYKLINELSSKKRVTNLCTVINAIDYTKKKYGYAYGGYSYGYGKKYGYGYGQDQK